MKHALRSTSGKRQKVPAGVGGAIRDYNCAKQFGWTVDQIDHTPADRLNRIMLVNEAVNNEEERIRKEKENKLKRARKSGKRRR